MKCTNTDIQKRLNKYLRMEFVEDQEVELHILKCDVCWKKIQKAKERMELKQTENLIKEQIQKETFRNMIGLLNKAKKVDNRKLLPPKGVIIIDVRLPQLCPPSDLSDFLKREILADLGSPMPAIIFVTGHPTAPLPADVPAVSLSKVLSKALGQLGEQWERDMVLERIEKQSTYSDLAKKYRVVPEKAIRVFSGVKDVVVHEIRTQLGI
jgi:hypothetical protein